MDDIYIPKRRDGRGEEREQHSRQRIEFDNVGTGNSQYSRPKIDFDDDSFNLDFAPKPTDRRVGHNGSDIYSSGFPRYSDADDGYASPNLGNGAQRQTYADEYRSLSEDELRTPKSLRHSQSDAGSYNSDIEHNNTSPSSGGYSHVRSGLNSGGSTGSYGNDRVSRGNGSGSIPPKNPRSGRSGDSGAGSPNNGRKSGGKGKGFRVAMCLICLVVLCFTAVFAYAFSVLDKLDYDETGIKKNEYVNEEDLTSSSDIMNVLLIGCDDAKGNKYSRSDTMILVSLDKNNKQIKLTSFLRDSYVYIPAKDHKAKLNSACSAGGPQYVIDTLEYNFGIDIEHYVMVDFKMFTDVVEALGGVDVEITQKEASFVNRTCSSFAGGAVEGVNHLNGAQALDYCRIRKLSNESDFNRTSRQRKVISSIIAEAKSGSILGLASKLDVILGNVKTDISKSEIVSLSTGAVSYLRYDIKQMQVPADGTWSNATVSGQGSVLKIDLEANKNKLHSFVYGD